MTKVFDLNKLTTFSQKKGVLNIPQDLTTVKKDVLTSKNFTVALICLETGQEIPSHPEPYGACFYVISGKGIFTIGKETFELSDGQLVFAPANEIRAIKSLEQLLLMGIHDPH
jgi:quercetin dioxygenase-like cupin family protein